MDLAESREPLDLDAVRTTLDATGWSGPAPVALVGSSSFGEAVIQPSLSGWRDMTSVVLESWDGELGPFTGSALPSGSALVV